VTEIAFLSATEQAALVRGRQVSPVELVSTYLERIEKFNPTLNAFVTVTADLAMDAARRAEAAVATGGELPQRTMSSTTRCTGHEFEGPEDARPNPNSEARCPPPEIATPVPLIRHPRAAF
jgi:hypothetical protein